MSLFFVFFSVQNATRSVKERSVKSWYTSRGRVEICTFCHTHIAAQRFSPLCLSLAVKACLEGKSVNVAPVTRWLAIRVSSTERARRIRTNTWPPMFTNLGMRQGCFLPLIAVANFTFREAVKEMELFLALRCFSLPSFRLWSKKEKRKKDE